MRLRAASALALVVALMLAGCGTPAPDATSARLLTTEEAQLLAVVRFKNFDAGTRTITSSFATKGTKLQLTGWFDYATDTGYAALDADGKPNSLLLWNGTTLAAHAPTGSTPLPPPDASPMLSDGWSGGAFAAKQSTLYSLIGVIEKLGSDRPENPLLLQQGGALWLRTDTIGTTAVTVFAGPTSTDTSTAAATAAAIDPEAAGTHYWVDTNGLLLRLEVRLGATWVTVDFGDAAGVTIANPFPTASP